MARTLLCEIVTPERIVYNNEVLHGGRDDHRAARSASCRSTRRS